MRYEKYVKEEKPINCSDYTQISKHYILRGYKKGCKHSTTCANSKDRCYIDGCDGKFYDEEEKC